MREVSIEISFQRKNPIKDRGGLSYLEVKCEHFEMNFDEEEFYTSIRNGFLKFQKILNKE
jgi:hypothetical protein